MGSEVSVEQDGRGNQRVLVPDYYWADWASHTGISTSLS